MPRIQSPTVSCGPRPSARRWMSGALVVVITALLAACSAKPDLVGTWRYVIPGSDGFPSIDVVLEISPDGTWHEDYPATGGYGNGTWEQQGDAYVLTAINSTTGEVLEYGGSYIEGDVEDGFIFWYADGSGGFLLEPGGMG